MILAINTLTSDNVTLTCDTADTNYPVSNLLDTRKSRIYRTTSDDDQYVLMDFTAASGYYESPGVNCIFIDKTNLTSGATIKIQGHASDSWGSPSFEAVITDSDLYGTLYYKSWTPANSYNYMRLVLDDSANPDGYIEIGHVFIGYGITMPGMEPKQSIPYKTNSQYTKSQSMQLYGDIRTNYRACKITWPNVTNTQRLAINAAYDVVGNHTPIYFIPWESDLDFEPPMYCNITDNSINWQKHDRHYYPWHTQINFEEVF